MWFKSIDVSRFRQFRATVGVRDLAPGLNVIAGDNEEGKSTLLQQVSANLAQELSVCYATGEESLRQHFGAVQDRGALGRQIGKERPLQLRGFAE